ncbi:carbon-nitrogen hydrolase family protein [bacterium]|nr:carbon-nitrogen hydrolase family protein [bacterium]
MDIRIVLYQQKLIGKILPEDFNAIKNMHPDFVCLPEYFFIKEGFGHVEQARFAEENIEAISKLSIELDSVLIGGSIVEKIEDRYFNVSYIFDRGLKIGRYCKVHLFKGELHSNLTPGHDFRAFDIQGIRVGLLICADVLYPESFAAMNNFQCDIVFVPTTSPKKTETLADKLERDEIIFVKGAQTAEAYIAKCCAVGSIFNSPIQARSLIASPETIMQRAGLEEEEKPLIISQTLSIDWIRNYKMGAGKETV